MSSLREACLSEMKGDVCQCMSLKGDKIILKNVLRTLPVIGYLDDVGFA